MRFLLGLIGILVLSGLTIWSVWKKHQRYPAILNNPQASDLRPWGTNWLWEAHHTCVKLEVKRMSVALKILLKRSRWYLYLFFLYGSLAVSYTEFLYSEGWCMSFCHSRLNSLQYYNCIQTQKSLTQIPLYSNTHFAYIDAPVLSCSSFTG